MKIVAINLETSKAYVLLIDKSCMSELEKINSKYDDGRIEHLLYEIFMVGIQSKNYGELSTSAYRFLECDEYLRLVRMSDQMTDETPPIPSAPSLGYWNQSSEISLSARNAGTVVRIEVRGGTVMFKDGDDGSRCIRMTRQAAAELLEEAARWVKEAP